MNTVDVATFKAGAEELLARAFAGEPTIIEQNGRAVLLPCEGVTDFELNPEVDKVLRLRVTAEGHEPSASDWAQLRRSVHGE